MRLPVGKVAFARGCAISVSVLAAFGLVACQTEGQRARNAELNRPAAPEMNRICALHGEERAAELKKLKEQTGLDLYCPQE